MHADDPSGTGGSATIPARVAVIADDLIWASRLVAAVQQAGALPVRMGTDAEIQLAAEDAFEAQQMAAATTDPAAPDTDAEAEARPGITAAIVDLFGHRYDGIEAVRLARAVGWPVVAVAQHDDQETRSLALDAGALRVYSYNKFFQDGPGLVVRLLENAAREGDAS